MASASPPYRRVFIVAVQTPLAYLIQTRMRDLGLERQDLGSRLGYHNPLKAAGRVDALCNGHLTSAKSQGALRRLPEAIDVAPELVEQAVAATKERFAAQEREAEEQRRLACEQDDREWRAAFKPHGVIQTERTMPSQITICGLTGGAGPRLMIPFDVSKGPITFIRQAISALPRRHEDGRRYVMFFGQALGVIINYSPDHAVRCDLEGSPLEVLPKAYRLGEVQLSFGGKRVEPKVMARILKAG
jgi:hypothetical protein